MPEESASALQQEADFTRLLDNSVDLPARVQGQFGVMTMPVDLKKGGALMQTSLNLTTIALSRPQNNRRGQTQAMILNSQWRRSLLIGGGILTLPIFLGLALWHWIVKQNWTMLPL